MTIFNYHIPVELVWILGVIFGFLSLSMLSFKIIESRKPSPMVTELIVRTKSWWYIAIGVAILILAPSIIGTLLVAYISFVALREMFSISGLRESDRTALFAAYFAIPVQYYLAYNNHYDQFLYFIPLVMFMVIAFILVLEGKIEKIGRSMPLIPSLLMLTVYMISYVALLYHVEVPGYTAGPGGLIIYLIILTAFNDVFQFTWGKMLGKRKIIPSISPNKTWEGFIGGVLTTSALAWAIRFLTPLEGWEALILGLILGTVGFMGDLVVSAVKRDLHLKDTDDLIPGHGGAMDRLDSIIVTAPVFFHLLKFFITH